MSDIIISSERATNKNRIQEKMLAIESLVYRIHSEACIYFKQSLNKGKLPEYRAQLRSKYIGSLAPNDYIKIASANDVDAVPQWSTDQLGIEKANLKSIISSFERMVKRDFGARIIFDIEVEGEGCNAVVYLLFRLRPDF